MLADGSDPSAVGPVIEGLVAEEAWRVGAAERTGFSDQSLRRVERQAKSFLQHVRSTGMMVLVSEEEWPTRERIGAWRVGPTCWRR